MHWLRYLKLGNESREGNAKLGKGNRGIVFIRFACSVALSQFNLIEREQRASKGMYALNFTIAFAFEIKPTGGKEHNFQIIVMISDTGPEQ